MMKNNRAPSSSCKLKLILFISCVCSFVVLPVVHAARTSVRNCDDDLPVKLKDLTITSGRNSNANAAVSIGKAIEEGAYAEVTVKLGMMNLLRKKFDICEEARKLNNPQISCPMPPGDYQFNHSMPSQIPRAKFVINVRMFDVERNKLGCFDLHVDMRK